MALNGGCHCGAIRYEASGTPVYVALCHCKDCRLSSGAPMVGWALFAQNQVRIAGQPVDYASSENATRQFCGTCGTGLFYLNPAIFPEQVDIQMATLDDPAALTPQIRIQMADAPDWAHHIADLPAFERFPA